ncbi:alpha/beta hydrolase [Streptomyces sp. NPDC059766]|uniref:alpha/beta hydrolase n=1 Tax=Streptomyces sp. NPDC059766 TaxID=3346940 RepID=UPI00364FC95D
MRIPRSTAGRRRRTAPLAAVLVCLTAVTRPDVTAAAPPLPPVPAPRLDWRPCASGSPFDCATAKVPLDYRDPGKRSIRLAVVRRKATGPGQRIGTLFLNPGGPGGPGTLQMPQWYEFFPKEVRERFDIVSWDPRGVGESTAVRCFDSDLASVAWQARVPAGFPVGARERAAWTAAYGDLAQRCLKRDPELLRHVSTTDTARDLDLLRRSVGDARLTYLGTSYGSFLGATYANLFPDRVRAMVLDGNFDPRAWFGQGTGTGTTTGTGLATFQRLGTDIGAAATLDRFLGLCGAAAPADCAFSAGSPAATRDKFAQLSKRLAAHPVGGWTFGRTVDDLLTNLYVVHPAWSWAATRLEDLWQGRALQPSPPLFPQPAKMPYLGVEQAAAVLCSDSPNPRGPAAYQALAELGARRAGAAGQFWAWASEACAQWPVRAADSYTGPWNRPRAHPLLLVNNTYDPATPYRGAQAMATQLADARLLTVEGYGHTVLLNPSTCAKDYESRYLVDGILPPAGATCRPDSAPFATGRPEGGKVTAPRSTGRPQDGTATPSLSTVKPRGGMDTGGGALAGTVG